MRVVRTGLVTDSKARTISGWFGNGLVLRRNGALVVRENAYHKLHPLFVWYLCKFRGYRKIDCSLGSYHFVGCTKEDL
ncbi:hypothetical protein 13VV501A_gene0035 [Vibrio phage 13VV501A]|nr:hypothetical protein 13VV501A_gene0035 [Vibrio phage 13VV501A]